MACSAEPKRALCWTGTMASSSPAAVSAPEAICEGRGTLRMQYG